MNNDNVEAISLINITSNNLQHILLYNFDIFDNNLKLVQQLFAINNLYIRDIVNDLLVSHNNLLLDIIMYIKLNNINILFSKNYYINLFSKWQEYNNSRINIYLYLNNCILPNYYYKNTLVLYNDNNFGNMIKISKYMRDIPQCYKDSKKLINNCEIATYHIKLNIQRVYPTDISEELLDYNNIHNFNLLCLAIKKHTSVYSCIKYIKSYKFTEEQMIQIINTKPSIYKYISSQFKTNEYILEIIICNTLKAFDIINPRLNTTFSKSPDLINNLIININNKNIDSSNNKNFVYFVLSYITNYSDNIEFISNNLHNNILYNKCFELIKPYLQNDYILFPYKYLKHLQKSNININYTTLKNVINLENISEPNQAIVYRYISEYNIQNPDRQIINNEWYYYQLISFINSYSTNIRYSPQILHEVILILLQLNIPKHSKENISEYKIHIDNLYFPILNNIRYNQLLIAELLQ